MVEIQEEYLLRVKHSGCHNIEPEIELVEQSEKVLNTFNFTLYVGSAHKLKTANKTRTLLFVVIIFGPAAGRMPAVCAPERRRAGHRYLPSTAFRKIRAYRSVEVSRPEQLHPS